MGLNPSSIYCTQCYDSFHMTVWLWCQWTIADLTSEARLQSAMTYSVSTVHLHSLTSLATLTNWRSCWPPWYCIVVVSAALPPPHGPHQLPRLEMPPNQGCMLPWAWCLPHPTQSIVSHCHCLLSSTAGPLMERTLLSLRQLLSASTIHINIQADVEAKVLKFVVTVNLT